jgi:GTPase Era involved in 16S rRNA processing
MVGSSSQVQADKLPEYIGAWFRSALALAEPASEEIAIELKKIGANLKVPSFRLAFIGEFSRGKSTLINRLLSLELLPVGTLPTTAVLTSITAGADNRMEVIFANGNREVRSLDELSWLDLVATDQSGQEQDVSANVRITLRNQWLEQLDVELVDAPGAGDLSGKRAALISQVLDQCDAAVLLTSATMPFSATEAAFLEQEVIGRHVPRVLVVVSKLDTLSQDDRLRSLKAVRERVAQISTEVSVLPLHSVLTDVTDDDALESVHIQIEEMVAREGRRVWRSQRIAGQIVDNLEQLVEVGQTAISAIRMSAAERAKALQKLQEENRKAGLEWERIRLELDKRRLQHDQKLRQETTKGKEDLLEALLLELRRVPDPKAWWERDLPFRLRRELLNLSRKIEAQMTANLAKDSEWFQSEVTRAFTVKSTQKAGVLEPSEIKPELQQFELTDIQKQRFIARVGSGASMAAPLLVRALIGGGTIATTFAVPIGLAGIALGVGMGMVLDHHVQQTLEKEKDSLARELEIRLERAVEDFCSSLSGQLRDLYQQLIEYAQKLQTAWQTAKEAPLKANSYAANEKACQQIIDKAAALRKEIVDILSSSTAKKTEIE